MTKNIPNEISGSSLIGVNTIRDNTYYQSDPLSVYQLLCHQQQHNILLESAEIDKKHLLKSLLLTDAALKIVCDGNIVTFSALSINGEAALNFATSQLEDHAQVIVAADGKSFQATFNEVAKDLDEKARLSATNQLHSLRLFNQLTDDNSHPFSVFLGGVFAFDLMAIAEELPPVDNGDNSCPDFVYYLAETLVIIDHELQSTEIIGNVFSFDNADKTHQSQLAITARVAQIKEELSSSVSAEQVSQFSPSFADINNQQNSNDELQVDISDERYCQIVEQLKENIKAGDIFQVVPSRTFTLPCFDSIGAYKALKISNPSPYMFYLKDSDFCIFGASPESALKYQASNRHVEIYPIAGTRPRGFDKQGNISLDLDSRIELELRQDKKESAEHIMLVDLARNDIARVSQPGTRYVADLLKVDRYSHVMHLVSRVCGTLQTGLDALHAYQACMNMGTLSGAPKVKATSLIREVEGKRRGSYGGAVGYLTGTGEMDTCIVIRSAFVKDNIAQVQAGAGVVYDSDPISEANETKQKAQAVINAIAAANASAKEQAHD
ncbi:anthranilate synthase component 1 [Colwellia psychrerythraea]|uniref:Anthranilate synthase component 1 n=1 Tax=Colwellia psychrerythraea TaxID=28229 RepID=A0A099L123_COLPS|nr:anthranilate synthase component 1 [Colwellia psychrerythraea]KGJ96115.1 anthranilate synthase component I [Colwellia psychrerythraea]